MNFYIFKAIILVLKQMHCPITQAKGPQISQPGSTKLTILIIFPNLISVLSFDHIHCVTCSYPSLKQQG